MYKAEKALLDSSISLVRIRCKMIEEGSIARSPVGIIYEAIDPGLVKYINPVVSH